VLHPAIRFLLVREEIAGSLPNERCFSVRAKRYVFCGGVEYFRYMGLFPGLPYFLDLGTSPSEMNGRRLSGFGFFFLSLRFFCWQFFFQCDLDLGGC